MFDLAIKMLTLGVVNIFDYTPELTYSDACNTLHDNLFGNVGSFNNVIDAVDDICRIVTGRYFDESSGDGFESSSHVLQSTHRISRIPATHRNNLWMRLRLRSERICQCVQDKQNLLLAVPGGLIVAPPPR
jgi:hypothetical protein